MFKIDSSTRLIWGLGLAVCLFFIFFNNNHLWAADPQIQWFKDFGGSSDDAANYVRQTKDGGYIMAGYTYSLGAGKSDVYLIKIDAAGKSTWEKTFGGKDDDGANCVEETPEGGYILAGYTKSFGNGERDIYLVKTDKNGNKIWDKALGGNQNDEAISIKPNPDGTYIIAGIAEDDGKSSKASLAKVDSRGNIIWEKYYSSRGMEGANWVERTRDNGYILTGYTDISGSGNTALLLIKTDADGNQNWTSTFGGETGTDGGKCVQQTADGGYIVVGYKYIVSSGGINVYLLKIDADGKKSWEKDYGSSYKNFGNIVESAADGGFVILGNTYSYGTNDYGAYILKIDASGNKTSEKVWGRKGPDVAACGQLTRDGLYVIAGTKNMADAGANNTYIMKCNWQQEAQVSPVPIAAAADDERNAGQTGVKGSIVWPDLSTYQGYIQYGKANGWGKVNFSDGGSYEGNWQGNLFNGQGTLVTANDCKYVGSFKDNMFYGQGIYTWPTGERYEGDFRYNKRNGEGVFTWPNGVRYTGEWLDDKAHGYGTIAWSARENYTGEMNNGQATGLGTYTFANGEKYIGQLSDLVFDGMGTYYWPSGAKFVGEFKSDRMSGQGIYTWSDGTQQWGFWRDDKYIGLYPEGFQDKER